MDEYSAGESLILDWWRAVVAEVALVELHDEFAALQRIAAAAKGVQQAIVKDFAESEAVAVPTCTLQQDVEVAEAEHESYFDGEHCFGAVEPPSGVGSVLSLGSSARRSSKRAGLAHKVLDEFRVEVADRENIVGTSYEGVGPLTSLGSGSSTSSARA